MQSGAGFGSGAKTRKPCPGGQDARNRQNRSQTKGEMQSGVGFGRGTRTGKPHPGNQEARNSQNRFQTKGKLQCGAGFGRGFQTSKLSEGRGWSKLPNLQTPKHPNFQTSKLANFPFQIPNLEGPKRTYSTNGSEPIFNTIMCARALGVLGCPCVCVSGCPCAHVPVCQCERRPAGQ